jgi:hypothetical protein
MPVHHLAKFISAAFNELDVKPYINIASIIPFLCFAVINMHGDALAAALVFRRSSPHGNIKQPIQMALAIVFTNGCFYRVIDDNPAVSALCCQNGALYSSRPRAVVALFC